MKVPPDLLSFLKEEDNFIIATHIDPEPDAIGSSIALSIALERLGKKTVLYDRDNIPEIYRFLPGCEKFTNSISSLNTSHLPVILLDCNTLERAGIKNSSFRLTAVVDHHETEQTYGDIKWIEPEAAATGIMVFYLLKDLGIKITEDIALNLYSAIAIDTGTFRYSNTTSEVFRISAELVEAGAKPAYVAHSLYETWSEHRFALLIMALNTLDIKDSLAITFVTKQMFKQTGTKPEDTENFANLPRVMKNIKIAAFFRELNDNHWKVSLRSKGDINVASIAKGFNGGGHKNAAGFEIKASLESGKEALLKAVSPVFKSP
ncbi:MAG: bifunctional oligoribonuclease/PAP phosphatase NrnA [Nitrospirae bacterium]|nr:bifunctional oligoribonuclease/PAP phosphatase NrnA [Nitrospirota bacterium]